MKISPYSLSRSFLLFFFVVTDSTTKTVTNILFFISQLSVHQQQVYFQYIIDSKISINNECMK